MYEYEETLCELWDEEEIEIKPHSRLYHLEPIGIGSPLVESLTSYITRLAEAHSVHPLALVTREILPNSLYPTNLFQGNCLISTRLTKFWKTSATLNGHSDTAIQWVQALERLTLRQDLSFLTMLFWREVLSSRGLLRRIRAWCPSCYEERRETNQIVYEPLLWSLEVVRTCPKHYRLLQTSCHSCGYIFSPLVQCSQPGYCARCSRWLGNRLGKEEKTQILWRETDWGREQWIVNSVGEMLANAQGLSFAPSKGMISASIAKYARAMNLSLPTRQLARQLGIDDTTLTFWLREQQSLSLENLLHLCRRFGVTPLQFLSGEEVIPTRDWTLSDVTSNAVPRKRRRFEVAQVRAELEAIIKQAEDPPPCMREVGRRLGYAATHLYHHFPDLCRIISARYRAYEQKRNLERIQEISEEVRRVVHLVYSQNRYPSQRQVQKLLRPHFTMRERAAKGAWKDELYQLGL